MHGAELLRQPATRRGDERRSIRVDHDDAEHGAGIDPRHARGRDAGMRGAVMVGSVGDHGVDTGRLDRAAMVAARAVIRQGSAPRALAPADAGIGGRRPSRWGVAPV